MGQILPVMKGHGMQVVARNVLPAWIHWKEWRRLHLTVNLRAAEDPVFATWLAKVRTGEANIRGTDDILVPSEYLVRAGGFKVQRKGNYAAAQHDAALGNLIQEVRS